MKAKKGQVLILVLCIMAMGLIILIPMLHFLNSSYNTHIRGVTKTDSYYAADAMMEKVIIDLAGGQDILNQSAAYNISQPGGWLNGYNISTTITSSVLSTLSPEDSDEDIYLDPGCYFGLNTLAHNDNPSNAHSFKVYLSEGNNVTVNWNFNDAKSGGCDYYCNGSMWIEYSGNGTKVQYGNGSYVDTGVVSNGASTAFQQQLRWMVPQGGSGNYTIRFQNLAWRSKDVGCSGSEDRGMSSMTVKPTFSGVGREDRTWVRISTWGYASAENDIVFITSGTKDVRYGANNIYFYKYDQTSNLDCTNTAFGGDPVSGVVKHCDCKDADTALTYQTQVYTIVTTARDTDNQNIVSVTACVRLTPGPLQWWSRQSLEILSWDVTYH